MAKDLNGAGIIERVGSWFRIWEPNPNYAAEVQACNDKIDEYNTMKAAITALSSQLQADGRNLDYCYNSLSTAIIDSDNPGLFNQVEEYAITYQKAIGSLDAVLPLVDDAIRELEEKKANIPTGWWWPWQKKGDE